jgi:hypothetical protein
MITVLLVNMHVVPLPILLILLWLIQATVMMRFGLPCGARLSIKLMIVFKSSLLIELTTVGIRSMEMTLVVLRPIALTFVSLTLVSATTDRWLSVMGLGRTGGISEQRLTLVVGGPNSWVSVIKAVVTVAWVLGLNEAVNPSRLVRG